MTKTNDRIEPAQKHAFAIWEVSELPEDLDDFHISCSDDDESQSAGYFPADMGAKLTIERISEGFRVTLRVPSAGLEESPEYWLSPSYPVEGDSEAKDFGIE